MTAPQRAVLKSGGVELAAKGIYLATLKTDLPLDFAALILPEPKQTPIAADEPMGGEPMPAPRPTPPAQEQQPGRTHAAPPPDATQGFEPPGRAGHELAPPVASTSGAFLMETGAGGNNGARAAL